MPKELSDNTRVEQPILLEPIELPTLNIRIVIPLKPYKNPELLWDAEKIERYKNIQNFYNSSYWGYGMFGTPTNYNPYTLEGQSSIESAFNYAKGNAKNFAENIALGVVGEGVGQAIKWAMTPVKIGEGAEAVVTTYPLSTKVTKVTSIPMSEMHIRNTVPGALKSTYKGAATYTQPKIRILSKEQLEKAYNALEKMMNKAGWLKITHPNLQGVGFTNGRLVVSDLGPGNVGKDLFGRVRLADFAVETVPEFRLAMQKRGGKLNKKINKN